MLRQLDLVAFSFVFTVVLFSAFTAIIAVRFIIRSHRHELKKEIGEGFERIKGLIKE